VLVEGPSTPTRMWLGSNRGSVCVAIVYDWFLFLFCVVGWCWSGFGGYCCCVGYVVCLLC